MQHSLDEFLQSLFDETTLSVHLQIGKLPQAKKGVPGNWRLDAHGEELTKETWDRLVSELFSAIQDTTKGFLEIDRNSSKVIQYGTYRIVLVQPPVTKFPEMTIVKPLAKLSLEDYKLDDDLVDDLLHKGHGILIAGAPGEGKSTFAQAFLEELAKKKLIIKTVEAPRDLQVPDHVSQYSFAHATHDEIRDILLLSRPDVTIYDEVRNRPDFQLYADLRLAGIGLIGVMHATHAIDSVQRFLTMIDMGMLPQVIDTVISIKAGRVDQILGLKQVVKTPMGMTTEDLARPVIQVFSRQTDELLYEIYTYSDNVIVMSADDVPKNETSSGIDRYAQKEIETILRQKLGIRGRVEVVGPKSIILYIPEREKPRVIGKGGSRITQLEQELGLRIKIKSHEESITSLSENSAIPFEINEIKKGRKMSIELSFPSELAGETISCLIGDSMTSLTLNDQARVLLKRKRRIDHIKAGQFVVTGIE